MDNEITYTGTTAGIDWDRLVADLTADKFHNGRTSAELRKSFEASHAVVFAIADGQVIGKARVHSDGVCNAYMVDVWTATPYRRRGIASAMVRRLCDAVPGQHIALFTQDRQDFYAGLGFEVENVGMSLVVGDWLGRYPVNR